MKELIIFGLGDIAQLADFYFTQEGKYKVVAFTADDAFVDKSEFCNKPVVPYSQITKKFPPPHYSAFVATGYAQMNTVRASKYLDLKAKGYSIATYISPRCTCWTQDIGENCFIFEDNTIQPFVKIGNNVTLWSGNHIGHHSQIGDNNFLTSHVVVSGGVKIGNNCFIGVNATIRDHIKIAPFTLIGAGALIVKDTEEGGVYIGTNKQTKLDKKSLDIKL